MKKLTMMIGIPCSGKTSWVDKNKGDKFVVSADKLRLQIHGQKYLDSAEQLVWSIRKYIFIHALEQGIDIIIDETNTTFKRRAEIFRYANIHKYTVDAVWMNTNRKICEQRCFKNDLESLAKIPVIQRMERQFEAPMKNEGFIHINKITE
jgi:predicted kinase